MKGELIHYYNISGCYILLPNSYGIWENIKKELDLRLKQRNVQNCYFPLLITKSNLEIEKEHIEGFSPEVAWVTKVGNKDLTIKDDDSNIDKEQNYLAIRPTSECGIYSVLKDRIRSYNDLPLKLNQWCNVIRWEFKDPTPFIRSREFLWQEGHTCFSTKEECLTEAEDIVNLYEYMYQEILAVPVIKGIKTDKEKFAGADITYTIEGFISEVGKGIQCATSHCLGQNFSKMFDIQFLDKDNSNKFTWQNSWGFTTRSIGVALMTHSDDKGAIIPPKIASTQIIIIPILFKKNKDNTLKYINDIYKILSENFRIKIDNSDHNPGWKFNYWERLGTPIRIEIGPRDTKNNTLRICKRNTSEKIDIKFNDKLIEEIYTIIEGMQVSLYTKALNKLNDGITYPKTLEEIIKFLDDKKICLIRWCEKTECEENIKEKTGAKSLCKPIENKYKLNLSGLNCICGNYATTSCLFGRSY
mgnify:CR=1 FL=1